jgi:hypothetical protein
MNDTCIFLTFARSLLSSIPSWKFSPTTKCKFFNERPVGLLALLYYLFGKMVKQETKLTRHIGLLALTFYGIGDILGAGVYGLIGKAAGELGNAVWLGFLISAIAAGITGLTYAS